MKIEDIRELCKEAHDNAVKHGFWVEQHDIRHYLMLVITELAEAVQAYRKNRFADRGKYSVMVGSKDCSEDTAFFVCIKDTFEDEMADACIRLMDLVGSGRYVVLQDMSLPSLGVLRSQEITETLYDAISVLCPDDIYFPGSMLCYLIRLSHAIGIDIE